MKHCKIISALCAASIAGGGITLPVFGGDTDILSVDFSGAESIESWSGSGTASFYNDEVVGNYMIADGDAAASALKTESFDTDGNVCIEFDMMIPTLKADGSTQNTIGGGMTGGVALMQGENIAGVVGYRGNSQGQPDNIISSGGSGSDYLNAVAGSKATAYRDQWMHYVMEVNTDTDSGDIYMINPEDGAVYDHSGRFDSYISKIDSLTNIGIVSTEKYSIGLANLRVYSPQPDKVKLSAADDMSVQYLPGEGAVSTVSYSAEAYRALGYNKGGEYVLTETDVLMQDAEIEYTVESETGAAENISINSDGLLEIQSDAVPGIYTVTAACGELSDSMQLEVRAAGEAANAQVSGADEIILGSGSEYSYKMIPIAETGAILPDKETDWSIVGDSKGCSISSDGILSTGSESGMITIEGTFTENDLSSTLDVYIRTEEELELAPVSVEGFMLSSGKTEISGSAITEAAISSLSEIENASLVIKAYDKNNVITAESRQSIGSIKPAAYSVKLSEPVELGEAVGVRIMILDADGNVISKKTETAEQGIYKGIPIVSDWYTNPEVGTGTNVNSSVPAGVDPEVVDTTKSNAKYLYDNNYPEITTDNLLWYKTGAYFSTSNIYEQHSRDWEQQALPIGNGYMGGMIYGMPGKDHMQFNEETFWLGGYRGFQSEVASNKINTEMGEGPNSFVNTGNLFVDFGLPSGTEVSNYYRDLNLDEAVSHVSYTYDGVEYNREYFASYPAQSIVMRYTADKAGALSFDVIPVMAHPGDITTKDGVITIVGKIKDSEPYYGGGQVSKGIESDLEYCTKVKVIADGGTVTDEYGKVNVAGADSVTIILTCATDYDPDQFEIREDGTVDVAAKQYKHKDGVSYAISKAESRLANTDNKSYDELKAEHIADYKELFDRVHFSLTDENEICSIPTNELQAKYGSVVKTTMDSDGTYHVSYDESAYSGLDKHLEELYYNYGRYMMIASSREDTIPANLQGKWCQSVAEIWGSGYTLNINIEMNYWFAGNSNLKESALGLIGWIESQMPAGKITSKNYYKIVPKSYKLENGNVIFTDSDKEEDDVFIMHTKGSIFGTTDITGSMSIQSPGNAAWLMQNVWNLYETTGDTELLRERLYPILRESANFYTQYMYANKRTTDDTEKYPNGYYYTTGSSRSPEQGPTQEGIYYDLQLVAGLFDYVIEAAEVLDTDSDKAAVWKEIRENIKKPVELGDDGQIKEWEQETAYNRDENGKPIGDDHHRHISQLVGLFPGTLVNRDTPEFMEGAKIVLNNRGDDNTGWSCAFKMLMWARLLDGDRALELFRYQLGNKTYGNLFNYHAPFQIDGNFGSSAGVVELLMQSEGDRVYFLPALPSVWDSGEITGLKSKNGSEIDMRWSDGKLTRAELKPVKSGVMELSYNESNLAITDEDGERYVVSANDGVCAVSVAAGETYIIEPTNEAPTPDAYTVNGISVQNGKCVVSVSKNSGAAANGDKLYAAEYNSDGTLRALELFDLSAAAQGDNTFETNCAEPDNMKLFIWNDNISPVIDAYEG